MRLTLRTLLAYMDGELERLYPQEAQEIGKKIQGSKFATDLFHKIRDVMRRLRLAAPSVTERGANLDCNTVAEYLDNELPDDRVPDFEEVCLKSEMHLAEVASCHQILAIAQVEPAEVAPESRQRMYQLPGIASQVDEERVAAAEAATVLSGDGAAAVSSAPAVKVRPRPVVPEYLRDPPRKRRLLPAAAITLLLGAVAGLALAMTGQFNKGRPIGDFLENLQAKFGAKQAAKNETNEAKQAAKTPAPAEAAKSSAEVTLAGSSGEGAKPSAAAPPTREMSSPQEQPVPLPEPVLPKPAHGDEATAPAGSTEAPGTIAPPPDAAPLSPASTASSPPASTATPGNPQIVPVPPPTAKIKEVPPPGQRGLPPAAEGTAPPGGNEIARTTPLPPAKDRKPKVARFTSDGQDVLLKYDAANAFWRRVLPEEFLTFNQRLLALPCYRSRIDVLEAAASARIELFNGTRIELLPSGPQTPLGVAVDFGHMIVKPLAQTGAQLRVVAGTHTGTLTLASDESVAAVEVTRVHEPGTDPEKVLSHPLTRLYVARGSATWEEGDKPPLRLDAPGECLLDKAEPVSGAAAEVPKWVTANTISDYDQRAAISVSQGVSADRSASLSLMELTEDRRKEVKNLAARCLGYLGQFDPITFGLNDASERSSWPDYYAELKEAIARGPETAAAIRQSLERKNSDDAAELYRMLWGYTDKDLESGEDAKLVKDLDHESPIFRVLAFNNLHDITNKGLYYSPQATAKQRQQSVQLWRQELQAGKIRRSPAAPKPRTAAPPSPPPADPAPQPPEFPAGEDSTSVRPAAAQEPVVAARGRIDTARPPGPRPVYPEPGP